MGFDKPLNMLPRWVFWLVIQWLLNCVFRFQSDPKMVRESSHMMCKSTSRFCEQLNQVLNEAGILWGGARGPNDCPFQLRPSGLCQSRSRAGVRTGARAWVIWFLWTGHMPLKLRTLISELAGWHARWGQQCPACHDMLLHPQVHPVAWHGLTVFTAKLVQSY